MNIIIDVFVLISSFYLIARVIDKYFVEALEIISKKLKLSSDISGATFMAVGSSAPELFIAIFALFRISQSEQAIGSGTIVGSAIFNILVIIGFSALVKHAVLTWQPVIRDMIFYISSILILLFVFIDGQVTLMETTLFLLFYLFYISSFPTWKKLFPYKINSDELEEFVANNNEIKGSKLQQFVDKLLSYCFVDLNKKSNLYNLNFLISIIFLAGLSHIMVESSISIAHFLHIPEVVIGLTILAAGTSIPDLLSSINVAKRGKGDMAVANAVGSNIFDINIGLGLPWFVMLLFTKTPIAVSTEGLYSSIFLLLATVIALFFLLISSKWKMGRHAGILLVMLYL